MIRTDLKTARYNAREAVKQLIALERHLLDPEQRCPDCIIKHALEFELLIDEGYRLDGAAQLSQLFTDMRRLSVEVNQAIRTKTQPVMLAEVIRPIRKLWQEKVF